jgi:WD40 repeat protein
MTIYLWNAAARSWMGTLQGYISCINAVAFSPNSRLLASGSFNDEVHLWDAMTGESLGEFDPFVEDDFSFLHDKLQALRLADVTAEAAVLKGHASTVTLLACSPDGQLIASGSGGPVIKL